MIEITYCPRCDSLVEVDARDEAVMNGVFDTGRTEWVVELACGHPLAPDDDGAPAAPTHDFAGYCDEWN